MGFISDLTGAGIRKAIEDLDSRVDGLALLVAKLVIAQQAETAASQHIAEDIKRFVDFAVTPTADLAPLIAKLKASQEALQASVNQQSKP